MAKSCELNARAIAKELNTRARTFVTHARMRRARDRVRDDASVRTLTSGREAFGNADRLGRRERENRESSRGETNGR